MDTLEIIKNYFPLSIKQAFIAKLENGNEENLQEIRLRLNRPLEVKINSTSFFLKDENNQPIILDKYSFDKILEKVSQYSLYAFQDEIKNGFITLKGGHRVGIVGTTVIENGEIKTVKNISSMNIRISHHVENCSNTVMNIIGKKIGHTLIISPPACGKTTLLRDMIKTASDKYNMTVGVIDERSELAGNMLIGDKVDIIDGCPKSKGMITMLRSMSPQIIAVDELGKKEDMQSVEEILSCGVILFATIHGNDIDDLKKKEVFKELITTNVFEYYIIMGNPVGTIKKIYDKEKSILWEGL